MKKKIICFMALLFAVIGLASCGETTVVEYQPAQEADIVKIENNVTDVYDKVSKGCVGVYVTTAEGIASGSGVVYKKVNETFYVVTNNHVVESATAIKVYLDEGRYFTASLIGTDAKNDVAVIAFNIDILSGVKSEDIYVNDIFNYDVEDIVSPGQTVIAIGCPLSLKNYNVCTTGVVSSADKLNISHTAFLNPGNSGGGLFNLQGRMIGLNYEKDVWTTSDGEKIPVEGRFFSIPLETVKNCINLIEKNGKIVHPVIGISTLEINSIIETEALKKFKDYLPADNKLNHVVIAAVTEKSLAQAAGLQVNDVILKINDNDVSCIYDLSCSVLYIMPGDIVSFTIYRATEKAQLVINVAL